MSGQSVWVTFNVVGFHRWPDAPPLRAYLRAKHRHVFKFRVAVETQGDRTVEFHDLLDASIERLGVNGNGEPHDFDTLSCEAIAKGLASMLAGRYRPAPVTVTVSEDGECGATVRHPPRKGGK